MAARLLARLIRFGGGKLLDRAVAQVVPAGKTKASRGSGLAKGGLSKGLAGAALARLATRSVPGAIVVGGGLLAKLLYDRRRAASKPAASRQAEPPAPPDDDDSHALG